jgi:catechol 2,3-dioxygenase-like lactoylglutathione lyase family enzyme
MVHIASVAVRVKNMEAMLAFYSEAFEAEFRQVDVQGLACQFGLVGQVTMKLVPLREAADFEGYPLHQLGFEVADLAPVLECAQKHGGRIEQDIGSYGSQFQAVVRDPDGNSIELYAPK